MTMYRRFCCNDLLRLGTLNLNPYNPTDTMYDFMSHLGKWPENCHVAYSWGGQIIGYVFGCIEGAGYDCTGRVSMLCLSSLDLDIELVERLENSCDEIYHAYSMRKVIHPDDTYSITECEKMGYLSFTYHDDGLALGFLMTIFSPTLKKFFLNNLFFTGVCLFLDLNSVDE